MLYDLLLLFAWVFLPWLIVFIIAERSFEGPLFQAAVYLQIGVFYIYFWRLKGQTLGMQVWKIKTVNDRGEILNLGECLCDFFPCADGPRIHLDTLRPGATRLARPGVRHARAVPRQGGLHN